MNRFKTITLTNDSHHIKTAGNGFSNMFHGQENSRHADDLSLLSMIDGFEGVAKNRIFSGSNLNEYKGITISGNDVDFPIAGLEVALEDFKTLLLQMLCGDSFPLKAE